MALKRYQPHRSDLLINTDWGIPGDALPGDEAAAQGLVLFHGRWVTTDERRLLREQQGAYRGIRFVAWMLWVGAALIVAQAVLVLAAPAFQFKSPLVATLALTAALLAVPAGVGVYRFARWGRLLGTTVLIVGIPSLVGLLCLYYLNRRGAREILVTSAGEGPATGSVPRSPGEIGGLRDLLGLSGERIGWGLLLAYVSAMLLSDLVHLALGVWVGYSDLTGVSVHLFEYGGVGQWVAAPAYALVWAVAALLGLRWVRSEAAGIVVASACYALLSKPVLYLVVWSDAPRGQAPPWSFVLSPASLLSSVVFAAVSLGAVAVALRWVGPLLPALLAGLLGGTVIQRLVLAARDAIVAAAGPADGWHRPLEAQLAWSAEALAGAALFAVLWYASIRLLAPGAGSERRWDGARSGRDLTPIG